MEAGEQSNCRGDAYELARRFEGVWHEYTVTDAEEILEGTLTTELPLGGCLIEQRFVSTDGSFSFQTFGYVDDTTGQWIETYALKRSEVSISVWRWRTEGDDVVVTDRIGGRDLGYAYRLRITFVNEDLYEVVSERSEDGGKTWTSGELTRTRRIR